MNPRNFITASLTLLLPAIFASCTAGDNPENRLQTDKKYVLESWPDSAYLAELDSILDAEPLKKDAEKGRTELTIYSGNIPTIKLPGTKADPSSPKRPKTLESGAMTAASGPAPHLQKAERFADHFMESLGSFQSDPTNADKYKVVEAKSGEDLFALLSRAYGKDASKLPRFYTLSTLQSVNPGVKLEHLNAGDKVRIPK